MRMGFSGPGTEWLAIGGLRAADLLQKSQQFALSAAAPVLPAQPGA
jgi:hypothetical protein